MTQVFCTYVGPREPGTWLQWVGGAMRPADVRPGQLLRRAPIWHPAWREHPDVGCFLAERRDLPAPAEDLFVATGKFCTEPGGLRRFDVHRLEAEDTSAEALAALGYLLHEPGPPERRVLVGAAPGWCPPLLPGQVLHAPRSSRTGRPVSPHEPPLPPEDLWVVQGPGTPENGGHLYPVSPLTWDRPSVEDLRNRGIVDEDSILSEEVQHLAAVCDPSGGHPLPARRQAARALADRIRTGDLSSRRAARSPTSCSASPTPRWSRSWPPPGDTPASRSTTSCWSPRAPCTAPPPPP